MAVASPSMRDTTRPGARVPSAERRQRGRAAGRVVVAAGATGARPAATGGARPRRVTAAPVASSDRRHKHTQLRHQVGSRRGNAPGATMGQAPAAARAPRLAIATYDEARSRESLAEFPEIEESAAPSVEKAQATRERRRRGARDAVRDMARARCRRRSPLWGHEHARPPRPRRPPAAPGRPRRAAEESTDGAHGKDDASGQQGRDDKSTNPRTRKAATATARPKPKKTTGPASDGRR